MTLRRALLGLGVLGAVYFRFLRRPILTWGATDEEAAATLPGDELLEDADGVATRAIDVDAPPSAVWPWLAQMGPAPRGGEASLPRSCSGSSRRLSLRGGRSSCSMR